MKELAFKPMNKALLISKLSIVSLILLFSGLVQGASLSQLDNHWPIHLVHADDHNYSARSAYLRDDSNALTIKQVLESEQWQLSTEDHLNFGFSDSTYWLATQYDNSRSELDWYIRLRYTLFDHILVYICPVSGSDSKPCTQKQMGDTLPFDQRDFNHPEFIGKLSFPDTGNHWVLTQIKTSGSYPLMISVSDTQTTTSNLLTTVILQGAYLAAMLVMGLYNLFIYISTRDRSYLYYSAFVLSFMLFHMCYDSVTFQFLWPNNPVLNNYDLPITFSIIFIFLNLFIPKFLDLKNNGKKSFLLFRFYLGFSVLLLISNLFMPYHILLKVLNIFMLVCVISAIIVGLRFWIAGVAAARFFTIAWVTFLAGLFLTISRSLGIAPLTPFTFSSYQIGSFLEIILLSLALGERITQLQKEKLQGRKDLIQSKEEKSQSLKQLVMGVSHEMNTPLGNIKMAESFVREEANTLPENNKAVLFDGLNIISKGIEHLETLSKLMKSSVALQENSEKESIEILPWFEAWKDAMEDSYEHAKLITQINCQVTHWHTYSNGLKNVLSHLVENSVQHNQERYEQGELAIKLILEQSQDQLSITYSDNGKGIDDEDRAHIFQPFFTTKRQAASSRGLGMYQTYNLITETLSGQIQWPDSQNGFKITLLFNV